MSGVKVTDALDIKAINIDGSLFMSEGAEFKEVILRSAHVAASLPWPAPRSPAR